MSLSGSDMSHETGPGRFSLLRQVLRLKVLPESDKNSAEKITDS